jgi:hypothetical protein
VDEEMTFVYDFGDYWRHTVKVVECVAYEKNELPSIRLLDGKNACPPNDVGGIHGYKEMLRVIKEDPDGREADEYYTWLGSKWDERFFPAIEKVAGQDSEMGAGPILMQRRIVK